MVFLLLNAAGGFQLVIAGGRSCERNWRCFFNTDGLLLY